MSESSVTSGGTESDFLLDNVWFEDNKIHWESQLGEGEASDLDDFPFYVCIKAYNSPSAEHQSMLNRSLVIVWKAYLAGEVHFNTGHDCANHTGLQGEKNSLGAGDGLIIRPDEDVTIKGVIHNGDNEFSQFTKVTSCSTDAQVTLSARVNYIIRGNNRLKARPEVRLIPLAYAMEAGVREYRTLPLANRLWLIRNGALLNTFEAEEGFKASEKAKKAEVKTKGKLMYMSSENAVEVINPGLEQFVLDVSRTEFRSAKMNKLPTWAATNLIVRKKKYADHRGQDKCWITGGKDEVFGSEKSYALRADGRKMCEIMWRSKKGAIHPYTGEKVRFNREGQLPHLSAQGKYELNEDTPELLWGNENVKPDYLPHLVLNTRLRFAARAES